MIRIKCKSDFVAAILTSPSLLHGIFLGKNVKTVNKNLEASTWRSYYLPPQFLFSCSSPPSFCFFSLAWPVFLKYTKCIPMLVLRCTLLYLKHAPQAPFLWLTPTDPSSFGWNVTFSGRPFFSPESSLESLLCSLTALVAFSCCP